ncbi:uncharacterized protein B0P05DRAFT_529532 [Gilbertella persicaria]|uniref:uncharacterized protein n=1 Tax=Gilbertella persicaria TaxID=101096 RepID=UPI00221FC3D5|nr:uncharacterized protein B0P05DRAFT_529532 [Gilbertella persicaria]KAI8090142.1 hypothetical protein B0P05DRAFT_529532 [Gilbertella persicaria]
MAEEILNNVIFSGFLLVLAGFSLALQSGCNATLSRYSSRSFSTVVSFTLGLLCCLIFFGIDIGSLGTPLPNDKVKSAPGYAWIGGLCGFFYVASNIFAVPRLGVGASLALFVCSQMIVACMIDNWGLVGVAVRPYTTWRILASLGAVFCVGVITKY